MQLEIIHHGIQQAVYYPTPADAERYQSARDNYVRALTRVRNPVSRVPLAVKAGATAFMVPVEVLQGPRDQRDIEISETRQKLMAFVRIVSFAVHPDRPNPFKQIAAAFNRKHPCIIHATHKYGSEVTAALELER